MTADFKYSVTSTNIEGDRSTARFLNARSAYLWAKRLKDEGVPFVIQDKSKSYDVPLAELKKEAGPCPSPKKKPRMF